MDVLMDIKRPDKETNDTNRTQTGGRPYIHAAHKQASFQDRISR